MMHGQKNIKLLPNVLKSSLYTLGSTYPMTQSHIPQHLKPFTTICKNIHLPFYETHDKDLIIY
jgi:hypothetical protein